MSRFRQLNLVANWYNAFAKLPKTRRDFAVFNPALARLAITFDIDPRPLHSFQRELGNEELKKEALLVFEMVSGHVHVKYGIEPAYISDPAIVEAETKRKTEKELKEEKYLEAIDWLNPDSQRRWIEVTKKFEVSETSIRRYVKNNGIPIVPRQKGRRSKQNKSTK